MTQGRRDAKHCLSSLCALAALRLGVNNPFTFLFFIISPLQVLVGLENASYISG